MSESPKCCFCLDTFTAPASIPCGHCFCLACIGEYWRVQGECVCPLCKTCFHTRPPLISLDTDVINSDGINCLERSAQSPVPLRAGEVSCDFCPVPRAAVRSCVQCLASYCHFHLQPHYQDAELGRHLLVGVVKNLEEPVCKLHGRQLERFCRTDQTCICAVCVQTDHRGHRASSIKGEAMRKKVQLKRKSSKLQQTLQERLGELDQLKSTMTPQNKELVKELEEDVSELQTRHQEIEQLLQTEDSLHFLQRFLLTTSL